MGLPESVLFKIIRATEHYNTFCTEMRREFESRAGELVIDINPASDSVRQAFVAPLPARFSLIVGDCIENLRSSLDFMVWELALAAKHVPGERHSFPMCETAESFKNASRSRLEGLTGPMKTEIDLMQPYHRRNDLASHPLWVLNKLANINKHRRVIPVDLRTDWAGKLIGTERYALTSPDSRMHVDIHPAAYVALNEREISDIPAEMSSVVKQLISEVEKLMPNFEQFF